MHKKVSVFGLGYIGLSTAAILASRGCEVVGVDINANVVATINQGNIHIVEPYLEELVHSAVFHGKLKAALTPEKSDVFLIAVPTPFQNDHKPDLSYIEAAAKAMIPFLEAGNLIILESTPPVGTTEKLKTWLGRDDLFIAYCPERVLPGQILQEIVNNDRIIGGLSPKCAEKAKDFYQIFVKGECLLTDARTAEMTKLTENAFRDVNIAFANELSLIAERLGINVWELIRLANRHPRVKILQPGPGVGGHCIAVDPWFIIDAAPDIAKLIRTSREVNDSKPLHVLKRAKEMLKGLKNPIVACFGLSFKADIDDIRESPALEIVKHLAKENIQELLIVEPHLKTLPQELHLPHVRQMELQEAVQKADLLLLLVNHQPFIKLDRALLKGKPILDTLGVWA
ncbi:MAG: UDP-N-acetyl-D-mannosaminuronic acid dehydrogenase [Chlamydiae bacterium RIFCSPHIGHO2_12_FULL_44_59]|nr:MAG: UDP-N-acetyl-D-mannosaminuronic acid dehydrogenase [Chlamydiae bacterium RIFCSPHIGHO2_01_FULL_44_39]OGN58956.1 MAG: UDP-N-acetyl-D-mannosaminuronic acid dehydrogenase [Chlamydiae bacterium RIFCSPHIGHO2_02_FULL_45_9]OGN60581.1 MAG: UDP-N-acetyl-D-mannosaminuronic acid dehydrogenase [Chlamydiae bacterium RIFCSPHIGHO2_12_FULL_44_59]OGN66398.1 MAG: UDP-N-acetyl-D-mannosaminuronic acid dehydrogenase [Chlamydiae bacterium RIFCSPLOWO2_01_FULL_44_52]OGN69448.1 MAG: UDP-N-acetyl-D-mannosaminuron